MTHSSHQRKRQKGAVIILTALSLLFLLGFMGIAMDFGRLFVVKTELQTASDSCALAAAQELDLGSGALTRATSAGRTAGNLNKIHFQGAAAGLLAEDVTFSDALNGSYSRSIPDASARYAKCIATKAGMAPWLLQALTAASGNPAFAATQGVVAMAVATRASGETNCALPIGICSKPGGYATGEWIEGAVGSSEAVTGQFRWLDLTGNGGGARELKDVLRGQGQCNLPGNNTVAGKPGNNGSAASAYNSRFGLYQGSGGGPPADGFPDLTGYSWYSNAALTQPPYPNVYPRFLTKRTEFAAYQGNDLAPDTVGLRTVERVYRGSLGDVGTTRRIVPMPMVDCAAFDGLGSSGTMPIQGMACVLLLHPVRRAGGGSSTKMWLEYRGLASDPASPCSTSGRPGNTGGPRVPALVQ